MKKRMARLTTVMLSAAMIGGMVPAIPALAAPTEAGQTAENKEAVSVVSAKVNKDATMDVKVTNNGKEDTVKTSVKNLNKPTEVTLTDGTKATITVKSTPQIVSDLIGYIYVKENDENTATLITAARNAYNALSDADKKAVPEIGDGFEYPGAGGADYFENTGDPQKDLNNVWKQNENKKGKKEILVVSFGTSFTNSRAADIGGVENALQKAYPNWIVRRAFTSQIITNHIAARDSEYIDNVEAAIERAEKNGVKTLVVQPTHLMHGAEYDELRETVNAHKSQFDQVVFSEPLLGEVGSTTKSVNADKKAVAKAITKAAYTKAGFKSLDAAAKKSTAFVFMGHGTSHKAAITYDQMQTQVKKLGYKNVFIGTVEGKPADTECQAVIAKVKKAGYKNVVLRPLMVVAGDHANNDMAGNDADSWKSQFKASKNFKSVKTQINGLGSIKDIQKLYIAHAKVAVATANTKAASIQNVKASAKKNGKVTVSWKKNASVTGYKVYRSTKENKNFKAVATVKKAKTTKASIKGQKKGKTYYYKVRGYRKLAGKNVYTKYSKTVSVKAK